MRTPLRVPTNTFRAEQETQKPASATLPQWTIPALILGTIIVAIMGFSLGRASPHSDMTRETAQVQDLLAQGKWGLAAALAQSALGQQNPAPSPQAKVALARLWYSASIEDLFANAGREDSLNFQVSLRWLEIERKADTYGLPKTERLASMTVAQRAYSAGLWPLSDTAFKRAWEVGDVGLESVAFRYAILRNFGYHLTFLTFRGSSDTREQGVRLLATAQAIAVAYNLPNGEACGDLQRLGYADCNEPSPDTSDLVLSIAKK